MTLNEPYSVKFKSMTCYTKITIHSEIKGRDDDDDDDDGDDDLW